MKSLKLSLLRLEQHFRALSKEALKGAGGAAYDNAGQSHTKNSTGDEGWAEVFRNDGRSGAYFYAAACIRKIRDDLKKGIIK